MPPAPAAYRELAPPPALAPFVTCVWTRQAAGDEVHRVVPDGCVDITWIWDGREPRILVAGPDTTPQPTVFPDDTQIAGVRFRPGAAGAAGLPLTAMRDQRVPVGEVWGRAGLRLEELTERLVGEARPVEALAGAVAKLLPADDPGAGPAIATALAADHSPGGVRRVAGRLGMSERGLHRRCLAAFGYGPKTVQRVLRFDEALRRARRGDGLAMVAAKSGYADQPHMAREVRALAGTTLTDLLAM